MVSKNGKFKCLEVDCDRKFGLKQHLVRHIKDKHAASFDQYIICKRHCKKVFKDQEKYKSHFKNENKKKNQCETCGRCFCDIYKLKSHIKVVHEKVEGRFKCQKCDKTFHYNQNLKTHLKKPCQSDKPKNGEKFQCEPCEKPFDKTSDLQRHLTQVHSGAKKFKCPLCDETFKFLKGLKAHKAKQHNKLFECEKCEFHSHLETDLQTHMTTNHSTKCGYCDEHFTEAIALMNHITQNHPQGSTEHKCKRCVKQFKDENDLESHNETAHTCRKCKGSFDFLKKKTRFCGNCSTYTPDLQEKNFELSVSCHSLVTKNNELSSEIMELREENQTLRQKVQNQHNSAIQCGICNETFTEQWMFDVHFSKLHVLAYGY